MIRRHRVAEDGEDACACDVGDGALESWSCRRSKAPGGCKLSPAPLVERLASRKAEALPTGVAIGDCGVLLRKPSLETARSMEAETSACVGQMSRR